MVHPQDPQDQEHFFARILDEGLQKLNQLFVQLRCKVVYRSKAKWVLNRSIPFKTVILDFESLVHVVQAFVNEVFCVC